jgi:tRNA(Ser,Leu) C12 N-acetylase TAN1
LEERAAHEPVLLDTISRVAPAATAFNFSSIVDFEEKAKNAVTQWVPSLMRASFHVRLHHRGRKEAIATTAIERSIGEYLLDRLAAAGTPGRIAFENPDAVIAVDTVDSRAGIGLWTRDDLGRYRFLRPD